MPELSVLLPSLRPEAVAKRIAEFRATNPAVDYELIIVSPFEVRGDKVVHVPEKERRGVIHAMNEAYKEASGEFIVLWSDDASPCPDCLQHMLEFVKGRRPPFVAAFNKKDPKGRISEQWSVYGKLYAGWLCASKKTIETVGGLFDPAYKNYWADPDLSLRVWEKNGTVAVCETAWIEIDQIDDQVKSSNLSSSFDADTNAFFDRWHAKFGKGAKRIWWRINCQIPNSLSGRIRKILRNGPYLKELKDRFGKA